jgi:hypothetical protein
MPSNTWEELEDRKLNRLVRLADRQLAGARQANRRRHYREGGARLDDPLADVEFDGRQPLRI